MLITVKTKEGSIVEKINRKPFHNGFVGNFVPH